MPSPPSIGGYRSAQPAVPDCGPGDALPPPPPPDESGPPVPSILSAPPLPPPAFPPPEKTTHWSLDAGLEVCKYGANCYNHDPAHRCRFSHPDETTKGTDCTFGLADLPGVLRRACRFGAECYQKSSSHLAQFAHPGDRNYRNGMVAFEGDAAPVFDTVRQYFNYYDPHESGHLTDDGFKEACKYEGVDFSTAWVDAGGDTLGHINFARFAKWAANVGVKLPVGVDEGGCRPCRFSHGTYRCNCTTFTAASTTTLLCTCGHKASCHRTDAADRSLTDLALSDVKSIPEHWKKDYNGFMLITDKAALHAKLQELLNSTHKTTDSWTRDRGCTQHGVGKCDAACAKKHKAPVPASYTLKATYRNQNVDMWQQYLLARTAIAEECAVRNPKEPYEELGVTSQADLESPLVKGCNEWRLLHGSSCSKCISICRSGFHLTLAGTGATWKDSDAAKQGTPLYGYGVYFAERVTKADEYSAAVPKGKRYAGLYCMLVCRVVGGRTNVITTNEIDTNKLKDDVLAGPYHSVYGDRESKLKKPYREFVVYDKDQVFPEYLLFYERQFKAPSAAPSKDWIVHK